MKFEFTLNSSLLLIFTSCFVLSTSASATPATNATVTDLTIGIKIAGGVMRPVIPRGSPIPVTRSLSLTTYVDN